MPSYRSKQGDTVDLIAWGHYGRQDNRIVERVLEANPGLADYGATLPDGVLVELPEIAAAPVEKGVRLWS